MGVVCMSKMCEYEGQIESTRACCRVNSLKRLEKEKSDSHFGWGGLGRPPNLVKRKRVICPVCKRRMWASFRFCHDGCCIMYSIPKHKVKKWWTKDKERKKNKRES